MDVYAVTIDKTATATVYVVAASEDEARKRVYDITDTSIIREIFRGVDTAYVDYKIHLVERTDVSSLKSDPDNLLLTLDEELKWAEDITDEDL